MFGFPEVATVVERIIEFGINISTLTFAASGVYALLKLRGDGVRRFTKRTSGME